MTPRALALLSGLALFGVQAAYAESPLIETQQARYAQSRKVWDAHHMPTGLVGGEATPLREPSSRTSGVGRTAMKLNDLDFQYSEGVGFQVKTLIVTLEPRKPGAPVDLDHVEDFLIRVQQGEVIVRGSNLDALLRNYLASGGAAGVNVKSVDTSENRIEVDSNVALKGLFGLNVPTSFSGPIEVTENNDLKLDVQGVKVFGVPVGGAMKMFGVGMNSFVDLHGPGLDLHPFMIAMNPRKLLPPPELVGRISAVRLAPDGLHLSFADAEKVTFPAMPKLEGSYIWIESGDPKFFGAVITNARIAIVPQTMGATLRFSLRDYRQQISAGDAYLSPDGLLTVQAP